MSRFHEDNMALVTLRLKEFAEKEARIEVLKRLQRIANRMVGYIDRSFAEDSAQFPEYTANLHDATGVAIYDNGRLQSFIPTQRATVAQKTAIGEDEWGQQELRGAINEGATRFSTGIWLVLFSASSYAEQVEDKGSPRKRGKGFFEWLWDVISIDIREEFDGCIIAPLMGLSDSIPF